MQKFIYAVILTGWTLMSFAQTAATRLDSVKIIPKDTTYWKHDAQLSVNANQGSFSRNWQGGGVNSIALGVSLNAGFEYMNKRFNWTGQAQLQYGIVKNAGQESRKSVDRIFLDTKAGYRLNTVWLAFGDVNLLSQFASGYQYTALTGGGERITLISNFFAPAYLTESIGLEYKPTTYFNIQFGAGTIRQTFVTDDNITAGSPKRYGVPVGRRVRNEAAFQVVTNYDRDIAKNIHLRARYLVFATYQNLGTVDHRLDFTLTAKINKFVNTTLTGIVLYDKDQATSVQYSQSLALGFLYAF